MRFRGQENEKKNKKKQKKQQNRRDFKENIIASGFKNMKFFEEIRYEQDGNV